MVQMLRLFFMPFYCTEFIERQEFPGFSTFSKFSSMQGCVLNARTNLSLYPYMTRRLNKTDVIYCTHYLALLYILFIFLHGKVGTDPVLVLSSWRLSWFFICSSLVWHANPSGEKRRCRIRANSVGQCIWPHVRSHFSTVFNALNLKARRNLAMFFCFFSTWLRNVPSYLVRRNYFLYFHL